MRASATIFTKHLHLDYSFVFYIFAALAFLSALFFQGMATDLASAASSSPRGSLCARACSAVHLWKDPKLWLLQCTNLTPLRLSDVYTYCIYLVSISRTHDIPVI